MQGMDVLHISESAARNSSGVLIYYSHQCSQTQVSLVVTNDKIHFFCIWGIEGRACILQPVNVE